MDSQNIDAVFISVLVPQNLKSGYYQGEAEQLFRDGLNVDWREIVVIFGCAGSWFAHFLHEGRSFVVVGDCDACGYCAMEDEEDGPSITNPADTLRRWLRGAFVVPDASPEELLERLLMLDGEKLDFNVHSIIQERERRSGSLSGTAG